MLLQIVEKGRMEDEGLGCLQVDFANAFLGGGALGHGCVQVSTSCALLHPRIKPLLLSGAIKLTLTGYMFVRHQRRDAWVYVGAW